MSEDPCVGPCNSRARKAWKDYEAALAEWKTADENYDAAVQAGGEDVGGRPEHPAEPTVKVWYGDPVFCKRCASNIQTALSGLDQLAGLLAAQVDGMRGLPSSEKETTGKRGKASTAPSVDPGVDDLDEMYRFLASSEDWWREARGYGPRPYMGEAGEQPLHAGSHPRSRTLGWLGDHVTDILQHADCGQFGLQVLLWERRLQDATKSRPELRHLAARCPRPHCGQRTLFRRDDGGAECRNPDCRAVMYGDEYEEVRDEDLKRGGKPAGEMQEAS